MPLMIALALAGAQPQSQPRVTPPAPAPVSQARRDQAWALGYSSFVGHVCPAWDQRTDAFRDDVLPRAETWNGPWAQDGPLAIAHRDGLHAAETAQQADPAFCDHPTRDQTERAALLNRVLTRRAGGR